MNRESENRLDDAARAMREAPLSPDALARGERAVLVRVGVRRGSNRPVLLWAAGFAATAAVVGTFALAPTRVSAAELRRIAQNADMGLRRIRGYGVQADGTLKLGYEQYAQNGRRTMRDVASGWRMAYDGRVCDVMFVDGDVERTYGGPKSSTPPPYEDSAGGLLASLRGPNARVSVQRALNVGGRTIDRYTVDEEKASAEETRRSHLTLDVDPSTERPLALRTGTPGDDGYETHWDYPAPGSVDFRLPLGPTTRVYDIPAEQASVLAARRRPGLKAEVGGQEVELLQVWVDEDGNATALARADYACPGDYGLLIDDYDTGFRPEKPPFSGQYMIHQPTPDGEQLMSLTRATGRWKRVHYPDAVTVRLPVCRGHRLLGYARFADVPVHRTHEVGTFFCPPARHSNLPFWVPPTGTETMTRTVAG